MASNITECEARSVSYIPFPLATETAGTWSKSTTELVQEIDKCTSTVTQHIKVTVHVPVAMYRARKEECGHLPSHI